MPHNIQAWLTDRGGQQVLCVDENLTVKEVAQLLEGAVKAASDAWHSAADYRPR